MADRTVTTAPEALSYSLRLLELLDSNAPLASFESLAAETRRAGLEAELSEAMARALRLRETSQLKRRREVELSALYETARDLSALRDTDQVLRAIVQRARQLVGSDIAYLSAADATEGDFVVRTTEGVISQDFGQIRVSRTIGVCGRVSRTRRPFFSGNYPEDASFDHDGGIDEAMRGEGIISILGIPLELETHVMGVLFVGDRYARSYTPQEMAVLSSLGAFAALAIENAKLLEEAQQALLRAREANEALRAKADDIEQAAIAHEQLTELIARGGKLEDLVNRVSNLLRGKAAVIDESRVPISGSLPGWLDPEMLARALRDSDRLGRSVPVRSEDSEARIAAVMGGSTLLGALVLTRDRPLSPPEIRTLERAAIVTGIVLLSLDRIAQIALSNVSDTVSALLRGSADPFAHDGGRRPVPGVSLTWPLTVMLIELDGNPAAQVAAAIRASLTARDTIFAEFHGDMVLITNSPDPEALAQRFSNRLEEDFTRRPSVVISAPIQDPAKLPTEHEKLRRCLRLLRDLRQQGRIVFEKSLTVYALLFRDREEDAITAFLHATIGPLIEQDEKRRSQLAATLLAYLDTGRSVQKAAEKLGIHVNTMRQRLDTVAQINPDWSDPARALEVHIALRLHHLGQPL